MGEVTGDTPLTRARTAAAQGDWQQAYDLLMEAAAGEYRALARVLVPEPLDTRDAGLN